ncbi:hydrogenase maturation protein [Clostridium polyendosporum]|uniref:Hydrogenase maturation protein n=1 Tax=Clostridium polyendosporum TaxID=69208 RepID=A0A919VEU2_9CLOT|nr:hydrogenase maturation protein [Clostridium polyendosporum]GIM27750.1 hydrogenase maturation protein [Clostridium polyendosporum]
MRILFLVTAHNSLSQRAYVELTDFGHDVYVQPALDDSIMISSVEQYKPDLIVAPFLKKYIPEIIWRNHTCIIVHPGIKGDRGPSSLDWAILNNVKEWGVTLLQANDMMDAGDIWASYNFEMRVTSKSDLYRKEVAEAAIKGLIEVVERYEKGNFTPQSLDYSNPDVKGNLHVPMKQVNRAIDWSEPTKVIVRKIRCADSQPGVLDTIYGDEYFLYGAHEEDLLKGNPGEIIAWRDGAICRATGDGALWITHLKRKTCEEHLYFKLPATQVLADNLRSVPEAPITIFDNYKGSTYREIWYEERNKVGYLYFNFYNGAMSTEQCMRLREAFIKIRKRETKVIVLMGGYDFWSNGIHLNVIEAAEKPSDESWRNINAINDLIREIINTDTHLVISAMQGNAAAGGVILALASDWVFARKGIVLNPHYKKMGLYGSEYWTYLLPKRVGKEKAIELTENCLPISTYTSKKLGLVDDVFNAVDFKQQLISFAEELANNANYEKILIEKNQIRQKDEKIKPLERYRQEELEKMWLNFYSSDSIYHDLRKQFVYKLSCQLKLS